MDPLVEKIAKIISGHGTWGDADETWTLYEKEATEIIAILRAEWGVIDEHVPTTSEHQ